MSNNAVKKALKFEKKNFQYFSTIPKEAKELMYRRHITHTSDLSIYFPFL